MNELIFRHLDCVTRLMIYYCSFRWPRTSSHLHTIEPFLSVSSTSSRFPSSVDRFAGNEKLRPYSATIPPPGASPAPSQTTSHDTGNCLVERIRALEMAVGSAGIQSSPGAPERDSGLPGHSAAASGGVRGITWEDPPAYRHSE